jgi:hypothetical protein
MTHVDYDHDALIAGIREHMREIDAFQNQFEDRILALVVMNSGLSIHAAIKAGLAIKPEYRENPIENPSLGKPFDAKFKLIVHEVEAS